MADQAYGNILEKTLLLSTFFFNANFPNVVRNPPITKDVQTEYDFIVVGGGSGGAVVAGRLSENPKFRVLLLEAGGEASDISDIPYYWYSLQLSETDWNYTSKPDPGLCLGMINKECAYARGKVLGGCSTHNHGHYIRGTKYDYDDWEALGNDGWGYEDVLKYFKKSEDNRNSLFAKNKKFHSTGGGLTVSDLRWKTPVADVFVKAGQELGYPFAGDFNDESQLGFGYYQVTQRDGFRCSTNKAFLVPAGGRKNLDVVIHAHVTKVLIDPKQKRAYGVKYFRNGEYHQVFAKKEVIISAGVFNSPQILMLSGIGPKDHLKDLYIPVIKDLPVGFNLQDHSGYDMTFLTDKPITFLPSKYSPSLMNITYELYQRGPLSSPLLEGTAFVNTKFNDRNSERPDIQYHLVDSSPASDEGLARHLTQISDEFYETVYLPIENMESFSLYVSLTRPKSIGRLLLRSKDPFASPILNLNYFSNKRDVGILADGGRIALDLMDTEAFREVNGRYHYVPLPTCPDVIPLSEEYFECLMRYSTQPYQHATGTCRMGPANDSTAVVDPKLRVHGISGLRVVDASVMPNIISGNTNSPTIMIGEKASDLIKEAWEDEEENDLKKKYY